MTSELTPGQLNYLKYIKPRYDNDPEFRKKIADCAKQYRERMKDTDEYRQRKREFAKKIYANNAEYREKQKQRALDRYYAKKAAARESVVEDA